MNLQSAWERLGCHAEATSDEVTLAYEKRNEQLLACEKKAPTESLQKKFQQQQQLLGEAYEIALSSFVKDTVINIDTSGEAEVNEIPSQASSQSPQEPTDQPSQTSSQGSSRASSFSARPLSQTKLDDLPDAGPGFDDGTEAGIRLQPGQLLAGRYEIKEQIGAGGMGAVYRALDNNTGKEIAVKVLLPTLLKNDRARERFMDEARISQQLSHPNIINVFDVQQDGDFFFLTMELLEGQDLRQVIENQKLARQPFDVDDIQELMAALGEGLAYAHKHTVHRDIKPENIWLGEDGTYKIMDFGIARVQSTSQRTQTGAAMGTAYYMAPEQLKGQSDIDGRADQYALAVMAYELLTGEVPAGMIEPVRDHRKDVPKGMAEAIHKGLASRPENRFENVEEFVAALSKKGGFNMAVPGIFGGGFVKAAIIILALSGGTALLLSDAIDWSNLYQSKEQIAVHKAEGARLQGEISVIKKRLDDARSELSSEVKESKRNGDSAYATLVEWQQLTDIALFDGPQLSVLGGKQAMANALLQDHNFDNAQIELQAVKVGYQTLYDEFNATQLALLAQASAHTQQQRWSSLNNDYDLQSPPAVAEAQAQQRNALSFQDLGEFKSASKSWAESEAQWAAAVIAVAEQVNTIDGQRAEARRQGIARDQALAESNRLAAIAAEVQRKKNEKKDLRQWINNFFQKYATFDDVEHANPWRDSSYEHRKGLNIDKQRIVLEGCKVNVERKISTRIVYPSKRYWHYEKRKLSADIRSLLRLKAASDYSPSDDEYSVSLTTYGESTDSYFRMSYSNDKESWSRSEKADHNTIYLKAPYTSDITELSDALKKLNRLGCTDY